MTFPQDRSTFVYQGPNQPILTPPRTGIELFTDPGGTKRADLRWPGGTPITDATVYTGTDGLLPEFLGPDDGTLLLHAQVLGTHGLYTLEARFGDALAAVGAQHSMVSGHGPPPASAGIVGGFYLDRDAKVLYGPKQEPTSWPLTGIRLEPPVQGIRAWDYPIGLPTFEATIDHPLDNAFPNVVFTDTEDEELLIDVLYPSPSRVVVKFGMLSTGIVHLRG